MTLLVLVLFAPFLLLVVSATATLLTTAIVVPFPTLLLPPFLLLDCLISNLRRDPVVVLLTTARTDANIGSGAVAFGFIYSAVVACGCGIISTIRRPIA